mmetsp:Transcript_1787/g.2462  ORF Transcript_1787/g.2462 Transcript_1787/m.2462 type:complete len:123 (-) Transcript_1787:271-639(-)
MVIKHLSTQFKTFAGHRLQLISSHGLSPFSTDSSSRPSEWRKAQLDKLESKFQNGEVQSDEELQPMWQDMERRVTRRRSMTIEEAGDKRGRRNLRSTCEDVWLEAGLYDSKNEGEDSSKKDT